MRNKKIICLLAAGLGALLLTGCGGENQKTYEQANADLEEANYDYALNEYQACISAGYKLHSLTGDQELSNCVPAIIRGRSMT